MFKSINLFIKKDLFEVIRDKKVLLIFLVGCFYIPGLNAIAENSIELTKGYLPLYLVLLALCFGQLIKYLMDEEIYSRTIETYLIKKSYMNKLVCSKLVLVLMIANILFVVNVLVNNTLARLGFLPNVLVDLGFSKWIMLLSITVLTSTVSIHESFYVKKTFAKVLNVIIMGSLLLVVYGSIFLLGELPSILVFMILSSTIYLLLPLTINYSMKHVIPSKKHFSFKVQASTPKAAFRIMSLHYLFQDKKLHIQLILQLVLIVIGLITVSSNVLVIFIPIIVAILSTTVSHGPLLNLLVENNLLKMNEIRLVSGIRSKLYISNTVYPFLITEGILLIITSIIVYFVTKDFAFLMLFIVMSFITILISYLLIIIFGERIKYNREKTILSLIIKVVLVIINYFVLYIYI